MNKVIFFTYFHFSNIVGILTTYMCVIYFQLVTEYMRNNYWPRRLKDNYSLNIAACRLIMNLLPGLELTVVFESVREILIFEINI